MSEITSKIATASKWSILTEVFSKIMLPISSMILARLLTPEAFGVVATTSIVISLSDLLMGSGFQKYLIQHKFESTTEKYQIANVAFFTNVVIGTIIWLIVIGFNKSIAQLIGGEGYEWAIIVAALAIPLDSLSSIHIALFNRDLNFKSIFKIQVVKGVIPLLIIVPLAIIFRNYWALIIGNIINAIARFIIASCLSTLKIQLHFSFKQLKQMLNYSVWMILDSILIWIVNHIDILIISRMFSQYHLGLYKKSIALTTSIMVVISSTVIPLIFPTFSQLQNDLGRLRSTMLTLQKYLSLIIIPVGMCLFLYSDIITIILFGDQWIAAAPIIKLWGITQTFYLLINRFCSAVYPAIGKPQISVTNQLLYAVVLIPTVIFSTQYGFETLYTNRILIRFWMIAINLVWVYIVIKQSTVKIFLNILPELLGGLMMTATTKLFLTFSQNIIWQVVTMILSVVCFFLFVAMFKAEREAMMAIYSKAVKRLSNRKRGAL